MKIFKEIEEQYAYVWWWLLNQGLIVSTILVNSFLFAIFTVAMAMLYFFMKWISRH